MQPPDAKHAARRFGLLRILLAINLMALMAVAVWFRCRSLGNVPGINGDEAWYGVKALEILEGRTARESTPTGNVPNWFFLGPTVLLHVFFRPSIALLRSVACLSGLLALVVNWTLCRWVFDRRTAVVSTVLLALLPINIAYSRFAWDASQSVAATLPVLYCSLGAIRFPQRWRRYLAAAILLAAVAVLVHPTNIFAGSAIAVVAAGRIRWRALRKPWLAVSVTVAAVILAGLIAAWAQTSGASRFTERMGDVRQWFASGSQGSFPVLYPRLFVGGTIYRYISGSRSWFEWPHGARPDGWALDAVLFWLILAAAVWFVRRSANTDGCREDRALILAWAWTFLGFLIFAGPHAMTPGWERWSICLIAPTVVLAARGVSLLYERSSPAGRLVLAAASLSAWLVLADFQANYFAFIGQTGGRSHETFRTNDLEPKQAALRAIVQHSDADGAYVVSSEWHICWPLRYLAQSDDGIRVLNVKEAKADAEFAAARRGARVWYVEFAGSREIEQLEAELAGQDVKRQQFNDYSGRPVLVVLHAAR